MALQGALFGPIRGTCGLPRFPDKDPCGLEVEGGPCGPTPTGGPFGSTRGPVGRWPYRGSFGQLDGRAGRQRALVTQYSGFVACEGTYDLAKNM